MKLSAVVAILLAFGFASAKPQKAKQKIAQAKSSVKAPALPKIQKAKRSVDLTRSVRINYFDSAWNTSKTQVDTNTFLIRDANTNKMVRVQMSETEVDSGAFSGVYSISWSELQSATPEIYAIPKHLDNKNLNLSKLNTLRRVPYIFKRDDRDQLLEAYPTREEALKALEDYKRRQAERLKKSDDIPESLVETAEQSKKKQEELRRLREARKSEFARNQALQAMETKIRSAIAAFSALPSSEQNRRRQAATQLVKEAMGFYMANQFPPAEERFKKAFELNPSDENVYFYYGVALYKVENFNESLVFLTLAKSGQFNPIERDFFKGLNLYRLDDREMALKAFGEIKATQDKIFAPTAAFYEGLVKMKMENYDEAQAHFQEVLDTSTDPALDQSAEDYIEKIQKIKAFLALKSKKYFATISLGMQYDSNVLTVANSSANAGDPSKVGDYRYLTGGSFEYRPVYEEKHEFSVKAKGDLIYSSKGDNVSADPLLYSLKAPYKYKGMLWEKGYKLEVIPGYELLNLDEDRSGATSGYLQAWGEKESYLRSTTLDLMNNIVMNDRHIMGANLKLRSDASESKTATGDNSPAATKWTLEWQNIWFLSDKKDLGLIGTLGYSSNGSSKNLSFNRYDISVMSIFPLVYGFQGLGGIAYFNADYVKRTDGRKDTNLAYTIGASKPLLPWLSLSLLGSYTDNQSTLTANTYNKYLLMSVLTANWSF